MLSVPFFLHGWRSAGWMMAGFALTACLSGWRARRVSGPAESE
jgi:hypothetical protein